MKRIKIGLRISVLAVVLAVSVANALETEVVFDGTGIDQWDTGRSRGRLEREFSESSLEQAQDPEALLWRFVPRQVSFNDIFLRKQIERPFEDIRVRVRNEGAGFALAAKVRDASGAEWSAEAVDLAPDSDWTWVEMEREQWGPASWSKDADGQLDFPLSYFCIIAFGVETGETYQMRISRIEARRPEPPRASLHALNMPDVLKAGDTYRASFSFSLDKPCSYEQAALILRKGETVISRSPIEVAITRASPGQRFTVGELPLDVPLYAMGGRVSVQLRIGDAHIYVNGRIADQEVKAVTIDAREPGQAVAAVKQHNGTSTLFINGEPHNGMAYTAYGPSVDVFSDFTKAGVDLYSFSATPTEAGYGLSETTWVAPDEYDYSQLDERVLMVLEANPDAHIFPRLYLHAPEWWSKKYPDDIVMMDPGDGNYVPFIHSGGKPAPCWASEQWREDTVRGLRKLIEHVENSPYADRIIGYHIASGTTEEWMMWGANENDWVGYSPANVAHFRDWLRDKYETDGALQAAWNDEAATFATAAVPPKSARQNCDFGSLRDPQTEQRVIDFYIYNSEMVAETICYFARAIKEMTHREKTVGAFYGYLLQLCGEQRQQNAGHLALQRVLDSPDVDFLCSPTSYAFRQIGGAGTSHFMSLLGSVSSHGKLWFDENDIRTSLAPGEPGQWGKAETVEGDILQQDKELANVLANGAAQWWFDVGRNRYDTPKLMERIGELTENASEAVGVNRAPVDEVAMIVDEKSLCYLRVGDNLGRELLIGQLPALHRIGAPVGHYLVSDLPRITDRKVFLVMTSLAPTAADRRAIDALKADGHVLVFCYASGLYRDGKIDESAMADFTGIRLRLSEDPLPLRVAIEGGHAITEALGGTEYGLGRETGPVCYADDPDARVLGRLRDGRAGLVIKEFDDWTAIHSASPMLPVELLRNIARYAGVHLYIDTPDVVWASEDLLAVSVREAGQREIELREAADVRDLYSDEQIEQDIESFEADFAERATRVFVTE